ncbi:MAG: hypothetical protein ICV74_04955 [Thermoleophilia bacterium]|nr:hypothetical protein [Thermoleophilia bacterium]
MEVRLRDRADAFTAAAACASVPRYPRRGGGRGATTSESAGVDVLAGGGGNIRSRGAAARVRGVGESGDVLQGGRGADRLDGRREADLLLGGAGAGVLAGGGGASTRFSTRPGITGCAADLQATPTTVLGRATGSRAASRGSSAAAGPTS